MKILIVLLLIAECGLAQVEPPDTLWCHTYGVPLRESVCTAMLPTLDGGFILAGYTDNTQSGFANHDFYAVKTDSIGTLEWSRSYGAGSMSENYLSEECYALAVTNDGGYVLAGSIFYNQFQTEDMLITKISSNGDSLWSRTYGGIGSERCNSMLLMDDGGFLLAGYTSTYVTNGGDAFNFWLLRTDSLGDTLWTKSIGTSEAEKCFSLARAHDSGYVLAGFTYFAPDGPWWEVQAPNYWLLKVNEFGDSLWSRAYCRSIDNCRSVIATNDGGYLLAGSCQYAPENTVVWVIKTNSAGDSVWTKELGGASLRFPITQTLDGNFALAGAGAGPGGGNGLIIKLDSLGTLIWNGLFGNGEFTSILQKPSGEFVCGGNRGGLSIFVLTQTTPDPPYPSIFLSTDSLDFGSVLVGDSVSLPLTFTNIGNTDLVISEFTFPHISFRSHLSLPQTLQPQEQLTADIIFRPTHRNPFLGNMVIESSSIGNPRNVFLSGTGITLSADDFIPQPSSFTLSSFPNPFNPTTTISFSLEKESRVKLEVFDVTGRLVRELVNEKMHAGEHRVEFDGEHLASGIYFGRIETTPPLSPPVNWRGEIVKMVLMK